MDTPLPFALFDIGGPEILLIFVLMLLLFGGKKLPELARGLGKSVQEFKKATSSVENEIRKAIQTEPESPSRHEHPSPPRLQDPSAPPSPPPAKPTGQ